MCMCAPAALGTINNSFVFVVVVSVVLFALQHTSFDGIVRAVRLRCLY